MKRVTIDTSLLRSILALAACASLHLSHPQPAAADPPGPPSVISPKNVTVADATPTYTWNENAAATAYQLKLFDIDGVQKIFATVSASACDASICSYTPGTVLLIGSYQWQMRSINSEGGGWWGSKKNFSVGSLPPPQVIGPKGAEIVPDTTPTYTFNAVAGATGYRIQIQEFPSEVQVDATTVSAASACSGSTCAITPGQALFQGDHRYRLRTHHESGSDWWGGWNYFTVAPSGWGGLNCDGVLSLGDFNGDGRTDRVCARPLGVWYVALSGASGLNGGTPWLVSGHGRLITGDFNGDGKSDIADYQESTGDFRVALSTGTELEERVSWGVAQAPSGGGTFLCSGATVFTGTADFNGDGRTDVYCRKANDGRTVVGLNNGSSFDFSIFADFSCATSGERVGTADMDGDGLTDWYCISPGGTFSARLSDGSGFEDLSFTGMGSGFCEAGRLRLADLNVDGAPDLVCPINGNVAMSTGHSFIDQGSFGPGNFCLYGDAFPADLNGDGVPEIVCNKYEDGDPPNFIPQARDILVRKWTGTALLSDQIWASYWCTGDYVLASGDFNGDGRTDVLCGVGKVGVAGTSGKLADLMTSATTELGGTTTVGYRASSAFPNNNDPSVRHVVSTVTTDDGRGGVATTTYSYDGATVDRQEQKALGFEHVVTTLPCIEEEAACPYVETTNSLDVAAAGRPVAVERFAGDGTLLLSREYTYTTNTPGIPRTALLTRQDTHVYGPSETRDTHETYEYDAYGNQTQRVSWGDSQEQGDELQTDAAYSYNTADYIVGRPGQVIRRTPGGPVLTEEQYVFDNAGEWTALPTKGDLTAIRRWLDGTGSYVVRTMTYDAVGNVTRATDETGRWVETTYDSTWGLFAEQTRNAANETATSVWDLACGVPTTVTDINLQPTTTQLDALCRPTRTDLPLGGWTERQYLDLGNPAAQRSRIETPGAPGAGGTDWVEESFDGWGRSYGSQRRGPSGQGDIRTETAYNARGAVASQTEPFYEGETPRETAYEYDALDRVVRVVLPGGLASVETLYDARSRTATDPNGKDVITRYDAYGRATETERSLGGQAVVTTQTYDPLGRLVGMQDAAGNQWAWDFDSLGRLGAEDDPDAGTRTYSYDEAGRLLTQRDALEQVTTLAYDPLVGRLVSKTNPDGTVGYTYGEARGSYLNAGRLTTVTSPADVLRIDYDALGRAVHQKRTIDGVDYEVTKAYDGPSGALSTIQYPDGDLVGALGYDEAGRVASIPGIVTSVLYDAAGRPLLQTNANSTSTQWSYTGDRGFLEGIETSGSGGLVQDLGYTYDPAGLVQSTTSIVAGEGWSYTYDDLDRIVQATNQSSPAESQSFTYDAVGRILTNSRVGSYAYPSPGEPRPHAPLAAGGASYTYDPNGNLVTGGGRTITWNADNLPSQITMGGTSVAFTYDGSGSRIKKAAPSVTSLYPFGDDYEITDGVITKYVSVEGLGVVAKRVGSGPGATTTWLHTDRLGSITSATDDTGAVSSWQTYRPYGETLASGGEPESRGWIDQRNDPETGLTYLHARYFDPQIGNFLSPDPLHPAQPGVGPNRYVYALGDPLNGTDRTGLNRDGSKVRGDCERFGWSCSAAQMGAGWGGMGGPGPGSMSSSELMDAYGGLPPVLVGDNGYVYPSANPERSAREHGGGWAYDPESGTASYVPGMDQYEPIYGPQLAVLYGGGPSAPEKPGPDASAWEVGLYALQVLAWSNSIMPGVSIIAAPELITVQVSTRFLGQASGPAVEIPRGAAGPFPVRTGNGIMYIGGQAGANGDVWGVRVMNATPRYSSGYGSYFNNFGEWGQTVNPITGRTIPPWDPWAHVPLGVCTAP